PSESGTTAGNREGYYRRESLQVASREEYGRITWLRFIPHTSSSGRAAASGATTFFRGCSWTGSSSWAHRSTTTSRTSSSRNCSSSRQTTPTGTSTSTSIRREVASPPASRSTTRFNI